MLSIGIDLGATKTNFGLIENSENTFRTVKINKTQTPKTGDELINFVFQNIGLLINSKVKKIGLALAGRINLQTQRSVLSPNLPALEKIDFSDILQKKFALPIFIENDAHAFTLAESVYGAGKGKNLVFGITLGTGIGSGFCQNQKIYHGAYTSALELGHLIIQKDGRTCLCGQKGCLEAYASASAIIKEYTHQTGLTKDTFAIIQEAKNNLQPAKKILLEASNYLTAGLTNVINIFEPDIIVLGGGLSNIDLFIKTAIQETKKIISPGNATKITKTRLGQDAGMIGAAILS